MSTKITPNIVVGTLSVASTLTLATMYLVNRRAVERETAKYRAIAAERALRNGPIPPEVLAEVLAEQVETS